MAPLKFEAEPLGHVLDETLISLRILSPEGMIEVSQDQGLVALRETSRG